MISRKALTCYCLALVQICSSFTYTPASGTDSYSKLKFKTMLIQKEKLAALLKTGNFGGLYFSSFYDKRGIFHKDEVSLSGYINTVSDSTMQPIPLEATNYRSDKLMKERKYASYVLSAAMIRGIVDKYNSNPAIQYYLFEPIPYDDDYTAYNVYAAGENKQELASNTTKISKEENTLQAKKSKLFSSNSTTTTFIVNGTTSVTATLITTLKPSPPYSPS